MKEKMKMKKKLVTGKCFGGMAVSEFQFKWHTQTVSKMHVISSKSYIPEIMNTHKVLRNKICIAKLSR